MTTKPQLNDRVRPVRLRTSGATAHPLADGEWRKLTYAQVLQAVNSSGQSLLDRGLSEDSPVVILSENDLEHFLLMLAGQHVGIPTAHISPVYSLVSRDF